MKKTLMLLMPLILPVVTVHAASIHFYESRTWWSDIRAIELEESLVEDEDSLPLEEILIEDGSSADEVQTDDEEVLDETLVGYSDESTENEESSHIDDPLISEEETPLVEDDETFPMEDEEQSFFSEELILDEEDP